MLGSCLRALVRGRLASARKEAQLQQLRFLNLHEYQVRNIFISTSDKGAPTLGSPHAFTIAAFVYVCSDIPSMRPVMSGHEISATVSDMLLYGQAFNQSRRNSGMVV